MIHIFSGYISLGNDTSYNLKKTNNENDIKQTAMEIKEGGKWLRRYYII